MARTRRKRRSSKSTLNPSTRRHISGIVQVAIGILLFLVLRNEAGTLGNSLSMIIRFFFGSFGSLFPFFLIGSGLFQWFAPKNTFEVKRSLGLVIALVSFLGLMHIGAPLEDISSKKDELAGVIGFMVSLPFLAFASRAVGYTVLTSLFLIGIFLAFEPSVGEMIHFWKSPKKKLPRQEMSADEESTEEDWEEDTDEEKEAENEEEELTELNIVRPEFAKVTLAKKIAKEKSTQLVKDKIKGILQMKDTRFEEWEFPGYDLLDNAHSELTINDEELKRQARLIEEKLEEFEIDVVVRDARPGPTVTQFTLQPAEGVRISNIASRKDDLALALAAHSLRIEAPIPGKSLVGVEMPNTIRTTVHLKEMLESKTFVENASSLTLPLGRDVSGEALVANLEDMPHLLIAGATGSGKSVCMNVLLTALLFQNAPHELKLILIDPKRLEFMPYDGIPHLLHPVITEAEKALQAFRWSVAEMGRRLHRFSEAGARNIEEYNEKQKDSSHLLPRIVLVVDELAELMMRQYRRDTETMIVRIAQMARAVGMHLIVSTQRPSVDVITGLIKANLPTRIAFRTVSAVDSRTILDTIGAEDLLGKGDMLFMNALTPKPIRIQGIFISTKEVERVINAVKIAGGGQITEQIADIGEEDDEDYENEAPPMQQVNFEPDDNGGDDLFFEAVRVVKETGKASASLLQRQLKVGYARAARLLDIMEEKGLVGPVEGAKPRKVHRENLEKVNV